MDKVPSPPSRRLSCMRNLVHQLTVTGGAGLQERSLPGVGGGRRQFEGEAGARVSQPAGLCSKRQPRSRRPGRRPAALENALDKVVNFINPTKLDSGVCLDRYSANTAAGLEAAAGTPGEALTGWPEFQAQGPPACTCWLRSLRRRTVLSPGWKQPVESAVGDPFRTSKQNLGHVHMRGVPVPKDPEEPGDRIPRPEFLLSTLESVTLDAPA
uniref:Uncharacterized protein n=1 Tax=Rangifer tarandus platyrhynchus TaxID=3082113 RepID=A0ACB0EXP1_RANTA|nr:unnamed protein product [Rangifer tarandus platyrhynchus]